MAAALTTPPSYLITPEDRAGAGVRRRPIAIRFYAGDLAVKRFLHGLGEYYRVLAHENSLRNGWLLRFRSDFHAIIAYRPNAGLCEFLSDCSPDSPCYLVGVWLLGRCATRQSTYLLEKFPADQTTQARKHYARALARVEAWPRLRSLVTDYPDDAQLAAVALAGPSDRFQVRLARYSEHVDQSHAAEAAVASQMPLWSRDHDWVVTPPKNAGWIRAILERIRNWVRGE